MPCNLWTAEVSCCFALCQKRRCRDCKIIRTCFQDRYGEIPQWNGCLKKERYRGGLKLTARADGAHHLSLDDTDISLYLFPTRGPTKRYRFWSTVKRAATCSLRSHMTSLRNKTSPSRGIKARPVHPDLIDPQRVPNWIRKCKLEHGERCWAPTPLTAEPPHAFRLIDVDRRCLVMGSFQDEYVALSYVRGAMTEKAKTTRSKLPALHKSGGLSTFGKRLPATIEDAMTFTAALGIKYLWVDVLCTVQDDEGVMRAHYKHMHEIYRNAYLTVVGAAGSGADAGLPGVTTTRPRKIKQQAALSNGKYRFLVSQRPLESLMGETHAKAERATSEWNTRAWTYQERIFSPRKVVFLEEGVHYNCNCMTWMEDLDEDSVRSGTPYFQMFDFDVVDGAGVDDDVAESYAKQSMTSIPLDTGLPSKDCYTCNTFDTPTLDDYCAVVREYTSRHLTKEKDILNAFTGILQALKFENGFHFGMPEKFFSACLLWQPVTTVSRRCPTNLDGAESQLGSQFPSWCWSGWDGPISTEQWYPLPGPLQSPLEHYLSKAIPATYRTATFSKIRAANDRDAFPIREETLDPSTDQPIQPPMSSITFAASPYILAQTEHSRFRLRHYHCIENPDIFTAFILDATGRECGIVQLHDRTHPAFSAAASNRTVYDFISISRGEIAARKLDDYYGGFFEGDMCLNWTEGGMYRYQNVMLLAWHEGVAFRAGLGRVNQRAWGASEPIVKEVVLG